MPPKKKATKRKNNSTNSGPPPKLARADSENTQIRKAIASVKQETSTSKSKGKLDNLLLDLIGEAKKPSIYEDYTCMLNQTNVMDNNNKFYVIQVAEAKKTYYLFTRWGRVGEPGANKLEEFKNSEDAEKGFKKKFQDKTGNKWENRSNFVSKSKKYTLLEMDDDSGDESDDGDTTVPAIKKEIGDSSVKCSLDERTELAVNLLFNQDMFENQMTRMDLDVRKMPLGKLSKVQIAKGLETLIELEELVKNGTKKTTASIGDLTSKFFTLIPHNFGRSQPPLLSDLTVIQSKKDVMMTLSDIELAQNLQNVKEEPGKEHPLDIKYKSLNCEMKLLDKKSKEFKLFQEYVKATYQASYYGSLKLVDVWELERVGEALRHSVNQKLGGRKLLWHGTSIAVVAAILNSGLRIMPHSGGCVGKGIYMASEYDKSAGYCSGFYESFHGEKNTTFMFLCEAALGTPNEIRKCNVSLKKAPAGFDSVIARGEKEPDPKKDAKIKLDGNDVIVPVGKPVKQKKWKNSDFVQSEYLIYNEHQIRLRYLLKFVK